MANVSLSTETFDFDKLEEKYAGFMGPSVKVEANGQELGQLGAAISSVRVLTSVANDTDTVTITIPNAYNEVDHDFDFLDKLSIGATLDVSLGYVDKLLPVFSGYITAIAFNFPNEGAPEIVVTGMDAAFKLMRSQETKMWTNRKVSDVVKEIAGGYGLSTNHVQATSETHKLIAKRHENDYVFIQNLATKLNYEFFIVGKSMYFRKKFANKSPVLTLTYMTNIFEFQLEHNLSEQVSSVEVRSWDPDSKKAVVGTASTINKSGGGTKTGITLLSSIGGTYKEVIYANAASESDAKGMAEAILNERALKLVSGEGECAGLPEIRAGRFIKMKGLGAKLDDSYYIVRAMHLYDHNGYRTQFQVQGNVV